MTLLDIQHVRIINETMIRKYLETIILFVVGLGPTLIALLLMQQYGAIGVSCAVVLSALYLVCIIIALCCRICIPPPGPDADQEELQDNSSDDLPPSYEIVTSKPPPYNILFSSAPPTGDITHARFIPCVPDSQTNNASLSAVASVHSLQKEGSKQTVKCYTWIESCEDKELPSYAEAVGPSSVHLSATSHLPE